MAGSVAAMRGLGPRSAAILAAAGYADAEALKAADPFEVYLQVRRHSPGVSLNLLYALIGAVEDRDWRDVARRDRTSILLWLDERGAAPR